MEPRPSKKPKSAAPALNGLAPILPFLGRTSEDFLLLAGRLKEEVGPRDAIEEMLVDQLLRAAERLRHAAETESQYPLGDIDWTRYHDRAERSFHKALGALTKYRKDQAPPPAKAKPKARPDVEDAAEEEAEPGPVISDGPEPDLSEPHPDWRSRIVLDPAHSTKWPVVEGTTIEAEEVVAALGDGHKPSTVMRSLPGLTVEDLRACLACDRAGKCGPFHPWDPPDAFERDGPVPERAYPM